MTEEKRKIHSEAEAVIELFNIQRDYAGDPEAMHTECEAVLLAFLRGQYNAPLAEVYEDISRNFWYS